ncbi:DUF1894 domain-containing protein [Methanococcus voltae]|uniref:DUF1894 domain-containing protein n=1 Tax=Methanococcus voltae (strain ATCC BAA-1334 / A3) TaxID=456320 RepID=D7DS85_METV3|nr:DUF1894 domain-containing protein [Methanococcus voltae]MCS3901521.1 hypothetical protein [Methanococcus voltae]
MASCIDQYRYEILLKGSFKECNDYIQKNSKSIVEISPGDEILDGIMIIGVPPIYMGFNEDNVLFPFTKPCYGTHVLKVSMDEYMEGTKKMRSKTGDNKENKENKEIKEETEKKGILSKLKFW